MLARIVLVVALAMTAACGARSGLSVPDASGDAHADLDASTFVVSNAPASVQFIEVCSMPGATHELSNVDDGMGAPIPLPFTFNFLGANFSSVTPSADGYIGFGTMGPNWGTYGIFNLPSSDAPAPAFFYYARDLFQRADGVCTIATGAAPHRMFVLEMRNAYHYYDMTTSLTIETFLEEGTDAIDVIYQSLSGPGTDGSQATVGMQNADGTRSFVRVHSQPGTLSSGTRWRFAPN